jgi:small-conductance mechanosensitive channel
MQNLVAVIVDLVPMAVVIFIGIAVLGFLNRRMARKSKELAGQGTFSRQVMLTLLALFFIVAVIVTAPLKETMQGNLISLFGIAVTAVIALSSTTLASNAMAGLMLRAVRHFKRGDYIRCGEFLGRVTERGLFHTEIQNERSDLITLPNLHLATNPVTVIRPKGTFVSAKLSLGYDIPNATIKELLIEAAESAGLLEAFVRIRELGDFSVTYEVSGRLADTKRFLGSKSSLHRSVLDTLHRAGVEIVSPNFMNQRQIAGEGPFIPEVPAETSAAIRQDKDPDSVVFDKADQVEKVEDLRIRLTALDEEIADLKSQAKAAEGPEEEKIKETIFLRERIRERLVERIADIEQKVHE